MLGSERISFVRQAIDARTPRVLEVILADPQFQIYHLGCFKYKWKQLITPVDNKIMEVLLNQPHVRASVKDLRNAIKRSGPENIHLDELILSKIEAWKVQPSDLTPDFIKRIDYTVLTDFLERANFDLATHGHELLNSSIERPTADVTEYLLDKGATFGGSKVLGINIIMSLRDDPEKVEKFLKDPRFDGFIPGLGLIKAAVRSGRKETVRLLLKDSRVDPTANENSLLKLAIRQGPANVVAMLINDERITPNPKMLSRAIDSRPAAVIQALLGSEKFDPSWNNNEALKVAARKNRGPVVEMLVADPRVHPSLENNSVVIEALRFDSIEALDAILDSPNFRMDQQLVIDAVATHSSYLPVILGHEQALPFLKVVLGSALKTNHLLAVSAILSHPGLVLSESDIAYYESLVPENKDVAALFDTYRLQHPRM